ncbi:trimeric intracellular cation channel type 1B.1-like isoform X2 [Tubulanus polymorphus]|uniref:trimeric intracellular cation channel type 1B.1-like isoform X2 n=1 Tax=Tubulanus polymorphus TaxID=672921 RepID=UPI003DA2F3B9
MDPQTFMDVATYVTKLKMYPYFDITHYALMCLIVRDDNQPSTNSSSGSSIFSRKHPLACWISSMLLCFGGSILANFLLGEPILTPFKNHHAILVASIVWYVINYSPFDLAYKISHFLPVKICIYILKEIQRTRKIYEGIIIASKLYPGSYIIIAIIGVVKGSGYTEMRIVERIIRGLWIPSSNEFLQPSFVTKASLLSSIVFICEREKFLTAPHVLIYFGIAMFLIYFRLSSLLLGIHDPFVPFENLFCAIFMGGMWDALKRAVQRNKPEPEQNATTKNDVKRKEEKKND